MGEIRKTIKTLKESGYEGFLCLEPQLQETMGLTKQGLFVMAMNYLKDILEEENINWN
jgi:predicted xylose isomerase-like sugar epimerase